MRRPPAALILCGVMCLSLAGSAPWASAEPALPEGFQDTVAFGGLEQPTSFRFSPDGRVFVAEKAGVIKVYDDLDDSTPEVFADLRTDVYDHGDRGLLGLALDPRFDDGRPYVYALYTYDHILGDPAPPPKWGTPDTSGDFCPDLKGADDCVVSGRLARLKAEGSHAEEDEGVPAQKVLAEGWCQQFSSHSIGDLEFGPEGALYASGGDGASFTSADYGQLGTPPNPCGDPPEEAGVELTPPDAEGGSLRAQNLHSLNGKIIRVDPDTGQGWPDNPMAASADEDTQRIVAEGFRNPFRFTIDPKTGEIYTDNVGSSEIEEIDRFGALPSSIYNSGWPCYEGPVRQFLFEPLGLTVCKELYEAEPDSTSPPFFYYSHAQEVVPGDECPFTSGSALGGIAFYESDGPPAADQFPAAYDGALFFTDTVRGCIYVMFPGADGRPDPFTAIRFLREAQVYPGVDIEQGPDGALYYASLLGDEAGAPGAIHRITYAPGAPTARLKADPQFGPVDPDPLQVSLDAGESSDPDGGALEYDWDLDGDGIFETSGAVTRTVEFTKEELEEDEEEEKSLNKVIAVRITDEEGLTSVARVTVYPGDSPPEASIDKPEPSLTWSVGQHVEFAASALDAEGHHLPGLSFNWSMRLAHCPNLSEPENCHKHPLQTFAGVNEGSFITPEHDFPSYVEVTLRVADDRGLTASKTVKIEPRTVDLSIASDPPGISLAAGLKAAAAPFSLTAIEGSNVVLSAPQTALLGGRTYTWQGWSDGGARVHTVVADESAGYVAKYTTPDLPIVDEFPPPPPSAPDPQTKLKGHPPKRTHGAVAKFSFGADQSDVSYRCQLDRGKYKPCRSPHTYRRLKPGAHTFRVVAIGSNGKADPTPATFGWKVLLKPAS